MSLVFLFRLYILQLSHRVHICLCGQGHPPDCCIFVLHLFISVSHVNVRKHLLSKHCCCTNMLLVQKRSVSDKQLLAKMRANLAEASSSCSTRFCASFWRAFCTESLTRVSWLMLKSLLFKVRKGFSFNSVVFFFVLILSLFLLGYCITECPDKAHIPKIALSGMSSVWKGSCQVTATASVFWVKKIG